MAGVPAVMGCVHSLASHVPTPFALEAFPPQAPASCQPVLLFLSRLKRLFSRALGSKSAEAKAVSQSSALLLSLEGSLQRCARSPVQVSHPARWGQRPGQL